MIKVLFVATHYSEQHTVAGERIRKFIKYLPEFGYEPYVLTSTSIPTEARDDSYPIYSSFEPGRIYRPIVSSLRRRSGGATVDKEAQKPQQQGGVLEGTRLAGIRRWSLENILVPDIGITWLPGGIGTGIRLVQTEQIDVIISSSHPNSTHLVAGTLATMTRKPWLADFRDGWLFEPLDPKLYRKAWRSQFERRLERWVAERANAIVTVSTPITDYFRASYPAIQNRCFTITNGYDPADWNAVPRLNRSDKSFWLVHTGAFSRSSATRSPQPVLEALSMLSCEVRANLRLVLVGTLTDNERALVRDCGLTDLVQEVGQVSHKESLAYQSAADCLLLMVGKDRSVATSKLFEYLYSHNPIFAVSALDTAAAEIVRETGAGVIVSPDSAEQIATSLTSCFQLWQRGEPICEPHGIDRYTRRELTCQLVEVLQQLHTHQCIHE
jgi:glycosyltransferase involved in cell wall biosynthesis